MKVIHDHVMVIHDHVTVIHDHVTAMHAHVMVIYGHVTAIYGHVTAIRGWGRGLLRDGCRASLCLNLNEMHFSQFGCDVNICYLCSNLQSVSSHLYDEQDFG